MAAPQREAHLSALAAMGFAEADALEALRRTNNDVNHAVELLSTGKVWTKGDDEFDLIAAAETEPAVRAPTVFNRLDHRHRHAPGTAAPTGASATVDPFAQTKEGSIPEMVDARISMFTEMGFTAKQAEEALQAAKGDVNEALNLLTGGGKAGGVASDADLY